MIKNTKENSSPRKLQKILKESVTAARTVTKNREIIETLVSVSEIKAGHFKVASSGKDLFKKVGI